MSSGKISGRNAINIVKNVKVKPTSNSLISGSNKVNVKRSGLLSKPHKKHASSDKSHSWINLNKYMNNSYAYPSASQLNAINHFFNRAECKYEWSVADFGNIPSEQMKSVYGHNSGMNHEGGNLYNGKTRYPFQLLNPLPEIAFLGKTNVGKSTILNNLITSFKQKDLDVHARMSNRAGFTKTLNCYNVGNKFRIIDTPGYGFHSAIEQGNVTLDYLSNRKELKRCFLLISAKKEISGHDRYLMDLMTESGIPFELIFSKMDKVTDVDEFVQWIDSSGLRNLPTLPKLIFTNSMVSKFIKKRYGVDLLRYSIFEACNLDSSVKPERIKY